MGAKTALMTLISAALLSSAAAQTPEQDLAKIRDTEREIAQRHESRARASEPLTPQQRNYDAQRGRADPVEDRTSAPDAQYDRYPGRSPAPAPVDRMRSDADELRLEHQQIFDSRQNESAVFQQRQQGLRDQLLQNDRPNGVVPPGSPSAR